MAAPEHVMVSVLPPGVMMRYVSHEYVPLVRGVYLTRSVAAAPEATAPLILLHENTASQSDSTRTISYDVGTSEWLRISSSFS